MNERYLQIAAAIKTEADVREHVIRKGLSGYAVLKERKIVAPEGVTRKQLYILAHECAHVLLHSNNGKPRHLEEVEAEKWAHAALRRHGVVVPRSMTKQAKLDIRYRIHQAVRRGARKIAPEALRYAKVKFIS